MASQENAPPLEPATAKERADATRVALDQLELNSDVQVTCETCEANRICEYAFDLYNTNGDCLAIK